MLYYTWRGNVHIVSLRLIHTAGLRLIMAVFTTVQSHRLQTHVNADFVNCMSTNE
jgi:hypothetical protein